jgi:hypothetical protein
LSLFLQQRNASILNARAHIQIAVKSLTALKETNGMSLSQLTSEYENDGTVLGMKIAAPTESEKTLFSNMKAQFLQGLVDNMHSRFPDDDLLVAGAVLDPDAWPEDEIKKAFFGDQEVLRLAQLCGLSGAHVVAEFRHYKQNVKKVGPVLKQLLHRIQLLPVSSSECERGFSTMNLDDTSSRNRLHISTLAALVFIKVNGPPTIHFQVRLYNCLYYYYFIFFTSRPQHMLRSGSRVGDMQPVTNPQGKSRKNQHRYHLWPNCSSFICNLVLFNRL